jgi:hypothetical protein
VEVFHGHAAKDGHSVTLPDRKLGGGGPDFLTASVYLDVGVTGGVGGFKDVTRKTADGGWRVGGSSQLNGKG